MDSFTNRENEAPNVVICKTIMLGTTSCKTNLLVVQNHLIKLLQRIKFEGRCMIPKSACFMEVESG